MNRIKIECPVTGKRVFGARGTAEQAVEWIEANSPIQVRRPRRAYQCPECGWWHLTSLPWRER